MVGPELTDCFDGQRRRACVEPLNEPAQVGCRHQKTVARAIALRLRHRSQQAAMNRHRLRAVFEAGNDRKRAAVRQRVLCGAMRIAFANNPLLVVRHDAVDQPHAAGVR